ncbi:MAG: hypothetical protein ACI89T_002612 [Cognaticolwellia sp.]|jgi:hypothetical protein
MTINLRPTYFVFSLLFLLLISKTSNATLITVEAEQRDFSCYSLGPTAEVCEDFGFTPQDNLFFQVNYDETATAPIEYYTDYFGVVESLSLSVGSLAVNLSKGLNDFSSHIYIKSPTEHDIDKLDIFGMVIDWSNDDFAYTLRLVLNDSAGPALSDSLLPKTLDLFDISKASTSLNILDKTTQIQSSLVGNMKNLSTQQVPEPNSVILLGLGLLVTLKRRRFSLKTSISSC